MTAESRRALGAARLEYNLLLLAFLAAAASLLAAIGVYGSLTYTVNQRSREIAVRKAVGATPAHILVSIGKHVIAVVLAGLVVGWLGARTFAHLLASQLWGITSADLVTYVVASVLLAAAALIASLGPARRALSVDPAITLRAE